jgi:hypothetical protein
MEVNRKKKLILIKPNGNHSNRLLQNLHFEVFCKEHQIEFQNPTFSDMAPYYANPCNADTNLFFKFLQIDILGKLFRHSKVVKRIFSVVWLLSRVSRLKLIRFDNANDEANSEDIIQKAFKTNDVVYVAGWRFRFPELTEKYRTDMAKRYALNSVFLENNTLVERTNDLKLEGYTLIGVHIRRGDYKNWKGGIYCYDDSVYEKYMDSIALQLSQQGNDKHMFVLFSNENIKLNHLTNVLISKESWYIDQHIMSTCDYLIGPPSTFTLWASYVGKAKLFHINNSSEDIIL